MKDKQIIVLGRGRSGTSVVAGLLHKLGVNMGESRPAGPNNPRGYFEDVEMTAILDKHLGDTVDKCMTYHPEFEEEFANFVKTKKGSWGWKQPKTLFLLPVIYKHLKNPYVIVCHREIEAHAKSIQKAFWGGSKTIEWCKGTIKNYYLELKKFFRIYGEDLPKLDVQFEKFFIKPDKEIKKICRFLEIPYQSEVKSFLNPHQTNL